jgi:hypothetical protein
MKDILIHTKYLEFVQEYFEGAPAIDVHNHIRQAGLALEQVWNT